MTDTLKKHCPDFADTLNEIIKRQFLEQSAYVMVGTEDEFKALSHAGWELVERNESGFLMRKDVPATTPRDPGKSEGAPV
jgi:hypothetical protein